MSRDTSPAMSEENVEAARRCFEAYRRGDYTEASALLAPDVVWEIGQELPARGPAAVREMWKRWDGEWEKLETVADEFVDGGDSVVVAVRYRGRGRVSGIEVDDRLFEVHTFRDGQCVRKVEFRERSEALEAVGLRE
jgi:ketosteroid isomerase-like protein